MKLPLVNLYNCKYSNSYEAFDPYKKILIVGLMGAYVDSTILKNLDKCYYQITTRYDDVYAITVNDSYTVNNWANDLDIKKVTVLSDGNSHFTNKLNKLYNTEYLGARSEYYLGVVTKHKIRFINADSNLLKDKLYSL